MLQPAIQSSRQSLPERFDTEQPPDVTEAQHRFSSPSGSLRLRPAMPGYVMLRPPMLAYIVLRPPKLAYVYESYLNQRFKVQIQT